MHIPEVKKSEQKVQREYPPKKKVSGISSIRHFKLVFIAILVQA